MARHDRRPRVWLPDDRKIVSVLQEYFTPTADDFYVLRSRWVGEAVALACGVKWSPAVATAVRRCLVAFGAKTIVFEHVSMVKGIVPRHMDHAEARKLSAKLRGRKGDA